MISQRIRQGVETIRSRAWVRTTGRDELAHASGQQRRILPMCHAGSDRTIARASRGASSVTSRRWSRLLVLGLPARRQAHSITGRIDSPLPFVAYILGAAIAVGASFVIIAVGDPAPPSEGPTPRRGSCRAGCASTLRAVGLVCVDLDRGCRPSRAAPATRMSRSCSCGSMAGSACHCCVRSWVPCGHGSTRSRHFTTSSRGPVGGWG